jgi:hypothetical protein
MGDLREASFIHEYIISFDVLVSVPDCFIMSGLILSLSEIPDSGCRNLISDTSVPLFFS